MKKSLKEQKISPHDENNKYKEDKGDTIESKPFRKKLGR